MQIAPWMKIFKSCSFLAPRVARDEFSPNEGYENLRGKGGDGREKVGGATKAFFFLSLSNVK